MNARVPPALERIVRHCLEKNLSERFQTARDVAFAIEGLSDPSITVSGGQSTPSPARVPVSRRRGLVLISAAGVPGVLLIAWFAMSRSDGSRERSGWAPPFVIGAATQVTAEDGLEIHPALSPDGKLLAYAAGKATEMRIFIRPVAGGRTLTLSESDKAFDTNRAGHPTAARFCSYGGTVCSSRRRSAGRHGVSQAGRSPGLRGPPTASRCWSLALIRSPSRH